MANMNILNSIPFLKTRNKLPEQIFSSDWDDRAQVLRSDVNMFCWTRSLPEQTNLYMQEVVKSNLPPIKSVINREELKHQLEDIRKTWKDIKADGSAFWQDVFNLTYGFLEFQNKDLGSLYLRIVDNNACTKFHIDGYPFRLFTTYYGLGSEWIPEDALNRNALGTSNEKIVKKKERVQRIETGFVTILKGEVPNRLNSVPGIVHRSPEITDKNDKRVILRIDI